MARRKYQAGCPCCCPDCEAPAPESTGSSSEETAWYLTASDPQGDEASFHVVYLTGADVSKIIDTTVSVPGWPWAKLRSYFATTSFVELWGVLVYYGPFDYRYEFYYRIVEVNGGETELVAPTKFASYFYGYSTAGAGISITYDRATATARVCCYVIGSTLGTAFYTRFYSYNKVTLSQSPAPNPFYGYGWGAITGTGLTLTALTSQLRYIDHCQHFPFVSDIPYTRSPWLKSTLPDAATLEISGVVCDGGYSGYGCGDCPALNTTHAMTRPAVEGLETVSGTGMLATADIDADCIEAISGVVYKIHFELYPYGTKIYMAAVAYGYVAGVRQWYAKYYLATAEASFAHDPCGGYDGANAIDGLVFNQWMNLGENGDPVTLAIGIPPVTTLEFPDFSGMTATISLP